MTKQSEVNKQAVETLTYTAHILKLATEEHEKALEHAVRSGVPFTRIGSAVGLSEAAVRQLAQRRKWYDRTFRRNSVHRLH